MLPSKPPPLLNRFINGTRHWRSIFVVLVLAVGYLALTPQPPKDLDTGWDKLNHLLAFAALACTASLGWPIAKHQRSWLITGLLIFGGMIEMLQLYIPGRSSEWSDLLADIMGIAMGTAVALAAKKCLRALQRRH